MLIYPQLSTGATAQYPITKTVSQRAIKSVMEDGTCISCPDRSAWYVTWRIPYEDLSIPEAESLESFFLSTQANLQPFVFLDPTTNLLSWSEDYTQAVWGGTAFSFQSGIDDPTGAFHGTRARSTTSHDQSLIQTTAIPGCALTCFSVYLRAAEPTSLQLIRTAGALIQTTTIVATTTWQRYSLTGSFPLSSDPSSYGVVVSAGVSIDIFGAQVDAQSTAAEYVQTTQATGVHTNARFEMPQLEMIATGPNRNACVVTVRANVPTGDWA